jgi:hypothetical protein
MGSKKGVTLSPAIEAQIAEVDAMTLEAVRKLLFDCMTVLLAQHDLSSGVEAN